MSAYPLVQWKEKGAMRSARWRSGSALAPPLRVSIADDHISADTAWHLACEGTALLWRGDYQNARQLLNAMARRVDLRGGRRSGRAPEYAAAPAAAFNRHRMAQSQRARILGMLLLPFGTGHALPLARAPDLREGCTEVYGAADEPYVASLREVLGLIGAHEWRRNGILIPALGRHIVPYYGVFSPLRSEYVELVAVAPLPGALATAKLAIDVGTGTGVLAAVLAQRGVPRIIAIDSAAPALACARDNVARLGLESQVTVVSGDLFPAVDCNAKAGLVLCNPPWLPARPTSPLEHAIYDLDSRMLRGFLGGLAAHLAPGGEGWLVLSDLAEHLGLRNRAELLAWIDAAGLKVLARADAGPRHARAADRGDALHAARAAEVISLWRLSAL